MSQLHLMTELHPEQKDTQSELLAKYDQLNVRYKHLVEERDNLSRQVNELRHQLEENSQCRRGSSEELKLLSKLVDEERDLRDYTRENGIMPTSYDSFARHDKLVGAFLSIISRGEKAT